jgi:hypothetical protein
VVRVHPAVPPQNQYVIAEIAFAQWPRRYAIGTKETKLPVRWFRPGDARIICRSVFRDGKRNGAVDAVRFRRKRRLRVELIGQHPFDQFPSLPAALGLDTQRRHLHAAFLPIEMKPGLATFCQGLLSPPDGEVPVRLPEGAVFDRIGRPEGSPPCLPLSGSTRPRKAASGGLAPDSSCVGEAKASRAGRTIGQ